jgi:small subunit ribosomal protein S20
LVNPSAGKAAHTPVKSTSAQKAARGSVKRHQRNKSIRSQVKTDIIRAEKLIFSGDIEGARAAVTAAVSALDKAAEKKILHGNNAARRKSRLIKKLDQVKAQPPAAAKPEKAA